MTQTKDDEMVNVPCWGGCGRSVRLRKASIRDGDVINCFNHDGDTRFLPLRPGLIRIFSEHKNDDGLTFQKIRDVLPDAEMIASKWGTYEIWAEKVAKIVIDKAMKMARGEEFIELVRGSLVHYKKVPRWMKKQTKRKLKKPHHG
jgi:hypothetical protein